MLRRVVVMVGVAALATMAACASAGERSTSETRVASADAVDSLAPLLRAHFGVAPVTVDVRVGQRVSIALSDTPWADSTDAVRFDRAYTMAKLVWDRYAAATDVDTVSVREVSTIVGGVHEEQYFFYPAQLRSREHPRLGTR